MERSWVTKRLGAPIVLALLLTSVDPVQLAGAEEESKYPGVDVLTIEEARRSDAVTYAENHGVSIDEALRRLDLQFVLGDAINSVQRLMPGRFAGGWIEHDPEMAIEVRFAAGEDGLAGASAILEATGVPVIVHTDAMHTVDQLFAGQDRITETIYRTHPDMGFYADVKSGSVRLLGPDEIGEGELKALSEEAGVPVTVQQTAGPARKDHTYGGAAIGGCTTGFTVRDAVHGTFGVLTAGHPGCSNSTATYVEPPPSGIGYTMTLQGKRFDANQDFAWYRETTHLVYPTYWDGSAFRDVWSTRARLDMVNYRVFKFGTTTKKSEGIVDSVWYNPGWNYCNGPCDSVWGLIDDPLIKCWGGDSGGPYFWAEQAWGIHSGSASSGPGPGQCDYAIFMTIGALQWDGVNTRVYER
ncbi:MAG: hypothetical protein GEU76_16850 [Alphaproteobacteria bacterium]|nr:hypothetical protein [Alphaproteobacteria bacterium]